MGRRAFPVQPGSPGRRLSTMARIWIAVAAVLVLTACGDTAGTPRPARDVLDVDVVTLDADGSAPGRYAALSESPVDLRAFAGWWGGATDGEIGTEPDPAPARTGTTYLAVTDSTRCRVPTAVEVRRTGDDLVVTFAGGTDREECYRAVGPIALLGLATSDVRGVRTVNGEVPREPGGPGRLTHLVELGTGEFAGLAPAELGATDELARRLGDDAAVLAEPVPAGERGFAFVLTGCAETGAVLLVGHEKITADLTGGEDTDCDAPGYFLATFAIPASAVPPGAVLDGA